MVRFFLGLFIFFLSWNSTFSIGQRGRLYLIVSFIALLVYFVSCCIEGRIVIKKSLFKKEDVFLVLFLFLLAVNSLILPTKKSLNYFVAYFYIVGGIFFVLLTALADNFSIKSLLRINCLAVFCVVLFVLIEFIGNLYGIDIQEYFHRSREARVVYGGIRRSYGFSTEPGVVAFYFNTLGSLALYYLVKFSNLGRTKVAFLFLLLLAAFCATFSAAGLATAVMSSSLVVFSYGLRKKRLFHKMSLLFAAVFIYIVLWIGVTQESSFLKPIGNKILLTNKTQSSISRLQKWKMAWDSIQESPFWGQGLGSASSRTQGSNLSWFLFLWVEAGLIPLIFLLLFFSRSFLRIFFSRIQYKEFYFYSFFSGFIHLCVISTFYYPFWLMPLIFYRMESWEELKKTGNSVAVQSG